MVKVNLGGNFLKADQAKKGAIVTFLDEGEFVKSEKYTYEDGSPKIDFIFNVKYEGENKKLRINKASKVAMVEAFGDDSIEWVNKKAKIMVMPTPNGDNKMIVLDPIVSNGPEKKVDDSVAWDE